MSAANTSTAELEFDARRYIEDRPFRAAYEAQEHERRMRSPIYRQWWEAERARDAAHTAWFRAITRQVKRNQTLLRLGFDPYRPRVPTGRVISIQTPQPI